MWCQRTGATYITGGEENAPFVFHTNARKRFLDMV